MEPERIYQMNQGYVSVRPTVRIRREAEAGGETKRILCFKGGGRLAREEIETEIDEDLFGKLEGLIGLPLICKERRDYRLPSGLRLEVSEVDRDLPTAFFYAEVEFSSEEEALSWVPETEYLKSYLAEDVTNQPGSSMGEYWIQTRLRNAL